MRCLGFTIQTRKPAPPLFVESAPSGLFLLIIVRKFGISHTTFALLTIYMFSVLALSLISRPEEKVGSWIWIHSREVEATQRSEYVRLRAWIDVPHCTKF